MSANLSRIDFEELSNKFREDIDRYGLDIPIVMDILKLGLADKPRLWERLFNHIAIADMPRASEEKLGYTLLAIMRVRFARLYELAARDPSKFLLFLSIFRSNTPEQDGRSNLEKNGLHDFARLVAADGGLAVFSRDLGHTIEGDNWNNLEAVITQGRWR